MRSAGRACLATPVSDTKDIGSLQYDSVSIPLGNCTLKTQTMTQTMALASVKSTDPNNVRHAIKQLLSI
jgi:hypothetical protein